MNVYLKHKDNQGRKYRPWFIKIQDVREACRRLEE